VAAVSASSFALGKFSWSCETTANRQFHQQHVSVTHLSFPTANKAYYLRIPSCIHQKLVNLHVKCEQKRFATSAATQYSCHVCLTTAIVNLSNSGEDKGIPALN
jgi:hypothetical protein